MEFTKRIAVRTLSLVLAASVTHSAMAQIAAPPPPPTTLWSFLGLPRTGLARAQFVNRRGNLPGLEKKPPLRNIADPANLAPDMPKAIQEAAKIKQQEDLAKQKIKAIKYLGMIGCGCYPGVKEGLLAALEDCTEEVRYEAVQAFMEAAGNRCQACSATCCDEDVIAKLNDMAYGMDENGCYKETSARIRAAAAQAAQVCEQRVPPSEVPVPETVPDPERGRNALPPPVAKRSTLDALLHPQATFRSMMDGDAAPRQQQQHNQAVMVERGALVRQQPTATPARTAPKNHLASLQSPPEMVAVPAVQPDRPAGEMLKGTVAWVGPSGSQLRLHFDEESTPAVGEELRVYHDYLTGRQMVGKLQVVGVGPDGVWARPIDGMADKIASGDDVTTTPVKAVAAPVKHIPAPVAVPRAPEGPAVQVTDEEPVAKPKLKKVAGGAHPVVQKHVKPRTVTRPATPVAHNAPVPRMFEAPQAVAPQSRPLPAASTGHLPAPQEKRPVAQGATSIWADHTN